ncbi:MAG TPA: hypothetical protein VEU94_16820, partial [Terriglobales bacterium]|nr:hypothetical protein [Terriglobales bacterium]
SPAIRKCDQRMDEYASFDRVDELSRNLVSIKTKDYDLNALFGFLNAFEQALYTIPRLDQ